MANTRTILCIKWGSLFTPQEVNILYRACADHLSDPLRFVCVSDTPDGLDPAIEFRPIPDIGLSQADIKRPGVWRKLSLYHSDLHDLGPVLFIDLDMVVTGPLAHFFDRPDQVTFLDTGPAWRPKPRAGSREAGTGLFTFDPAREAHILKDFLADPAHHMATTRNEQDFVSARLQDHGFWPDGAVVSFKRHLCWRYGIGMVRKPVQPAPETSVVAFHGTPRPSDTFQNRVWGPAPHWHLG